MSKSVGKPEGEEEAKPAAPAPGAASQTEDTTDYWAQFASRHADPNGSGAASEDQSDDDTGEGDSASSNQEPRETTTQADAEKVTQSKNQPSTEASKPAASAPGKDDEPGDDDIWARADKDPRTKALKDAFDAAPSDTARQAIEDTQRRLLTNGQEIARLRSERSSLKKPAASAAPGKTETAEPDFDITKDPDWIATRDEYPEALGAVQKILQKVMGSTFSKVEKQIKPLAESSTAAIALVEREALGEQNRLIHSMHDDYSDVVTSKGFPETFKEWYDGQPPKIQEMADNNWDKVRDASEAGTVFTLFKAQTRFGVGVARDKPAGENSPAKSETDPSKSAKRRQQLAASTAVSQRGPGVSSNPDVDDEEYWRKHWADKKTAQLQAEGAIH